MFSGYVFKEKIVTKPTMNSKAMRMQHTINLLGWVGVLLGLVLLLLFFVSEAIRSNPAMYDVWYGIKMIGELSLPLSVVLIFGGIVLACMNIIPSDKEISSLDTKKNNPLDTHKIRFAIGEITKEQYDQIKKDLEDSYKKP